jgi:hypothetical protein
MSDSSKNWYEHNRYLRTLYEHNDLPPYPKTLEEIKLWLDKFDETAPEETYKMIMKRLPDDKEMEKEIQKVLVRNEDIKKYGVLYTSIELDNYTIEVRGKGIYRTSWIKRICLRLCWMIRSLTLNPLKKC